MPVFFEFFEADSELLEQYLPGVEGAVAQDFAHREELGLVVNDNAGVGRQVALAVGESVERIDGLVR